MSMLVQLSYIGILLHIEENCWSGIFELLSWSQIDTFIWGNEIASFTVFRNGPHKHIFRMNLPFKVMTMMRRRVQHTFELLVLESPPDLFKLLALWFQRDWWKNFRFLAKTFQPPICQLTYCLPIETSFKHTALILRGSNYQRHVCNTLRWDFCVKKGSR